MRGPRILDYVSDWELEEIRHELAAGEEPAFVAFRHGVPKGVLTRALAYKDAKDCKRNGRWDKESVQFVYDNYPTRGKDWEGWAQLGRSWSAIQSKAFSLGLVKPRDNILWKDWEIDYLRENYQCHGKDWDGWARLDRTWYSIVNKAHTLKLCRAKRGRPAKWYN